MSSYSFEIVRRGLDRYSWLFVQVLDGRRHVLARGGRDFRTKKRAKKAVTILQEEVAGAEIIDATDDGDPFELPATSFEIAPYAVPLLVGPSPVRRAAAVGRRPNGAASRLSNGDAPVHITAPAEPVPGTDVEITATPTKKAAAPAGAQRAGGRRPRKSAPAEAR